MNEFKVGDRVVCVNKFDEIEIGMTGEIGQIKDTGDNFGVIWSGFYEGHDDIDGLRDGEDNGYYIPKSSVLKIKGNPKANTLTLLEKEKTFRNYLLLNKQDESCLIKMYKNPSLKKWYFHIEGDAGIYREDLLKIEAILRGLESCQV